MTRRLSSPKNIDNTSRYVSWRKRSAFTLIELLVVIAIISILASLLVPAVTGALERGRQAVCSSNQHQIHVGAMSYAADHDGMFPGFGNNVLDARGEASRWLYIGQIQPPGNDAGQVWQNHGKLYQAEYVNGGDMFYCPSQIESPDFRFSSYQPWPTARSWGGGNGVRSAYQFNPEVRGERGRGDLTRRVQGTIDLIDTPPNTVFVVDVIQSVGFISHFYQETAAFNMMFTDGGVRLKKTPADSKVMQSLISGRFYDVLTGLKDQ